MLVAEGAATVPLGGDTLCLLGHEVGDHVRRRSESGGNISSSELDVMAAEMDAHVNVSRSGLVGGMQCHGDCAFIVAEQHGWKRLSETEIAQEET